MSECQTCGTPLTDLNATEFRHVHDIGKCADLLLIQRDSARATIDARDKTIAELRNAIRTNGCPCRIITPCRSSCSCGNPGLSGGCDRCSLYGSADARLWAPA